MIIKTLIPSDRVLFKTLLLKIRRAKRTIIYKDGSVKVGDTIRLMATGKEYLVTELGIRTPNEIKTKELLCNISNIYISTT